MDRRHVVLVTYGEPPTPAFGEQLVYSWRILLGLTRTVAPIPRPLLPMIALARARGRNKSWVENRYASPLEPITASQAARLQEALAAADEGRPWQVHVAYEFRKPLLGDVLARIPAHEPVWVAPMYAADSAFTHALSRDTAAAFQSAVARAQAVRVMGALDVELLADLSAAHVLDHAGDGDLWRGADVALVLAAHGTLINPPKPIDTGLEATEALCAALTVRLGDHFGMVVNGWLNHTRGGKWTDPPIEAALAKVADAGFSRVVYFPYGFLADNAESELEGRAALAGHPEIESLHLPCLNDSPRLLAALAREILRAA